MQQWSGFPTPQRTSTHLRKYKDELQNSFQESAILVIATAFPSWGCPFSANAELKEI